MNDPNIVKITYSEQATLFPEERGDRVRRFVRHWLRRWKLIAPPPALNLFQSNMAAFRFETDDGRVCIVPFTKELIDDVGMSQAEAFALETALEKLRDLNGAQPAIPSAN